MEPRPALSYALRARIPPVGVNEHRPLWSVLIPTYQDGVYLEEALRSVLVQDRGEQLMEILVVDDASRPPAEPRVRAIAGDRASYFRQERNVGKVRNYELGLIASRGRLIHQLHGDDRVLPGFYVAMEQAFDDYPEAGAFFGRVAYINCAGQTTGESGSVCNKTGIWSGALEQLLIKQHIQTPAMVCRREVYETLGGFDRRFDCMEDWEMWIRVANRFPLGYIHAVVAEYRSHIDNTTSTRLRSGVRFSTLRLLHQVTRNYVSAEAANRVRRAQARAAAGMWMNFIPQAVAERRWGLLRRLLIEAMSYDPSLSCVRRCAGMIRHGLM